VGHQFDQRADNGAPVHFEMIHCAHFQNLLVVNVWVFSSIFYNRYSRMHMRDAGIVESVIKLKRFVGRRCVVLVVVSEQRNIDEESFLH